MSTRGRLLASLALVAAISAAGCYKGVDAVQLGMNSLTVEREICGPPLRKIYGKGMDVDKYTYVYPTGWVHFFKHQVVKVELVGEGGTVTGRLKQQREKQVLP
ncbi:MAG: hypothetical protein ACYTGB_04690 [Planctomycetota bacterium]|jgi:hypothetical protein